MNPVTENVLAILKSEQSWVSGERIGLQLGMTRSAVSKHVAALRKCGYDIESSSRRGHILRSVSDAPYPVEVAPLLKTAYVGRRLLFFDKVDSTNTVASREAASGAPEGTVVAADSQTEGRGRLQRTWNSPPGNSLYFSIILRPTIEPSRMPEIALVAAVSIHRALLRFHAGLPALIKWPNDVVVRHRKLCGILCESEAETDAVHHVITGIGINVNAKSFPAELNDIATSLYLETGQKTLRYALLAEVLNSFESCYEQWKKSRDLAPVLPYMEKYSFLKGRKVIVKTVNEELRGRVKGITAAGGLILENGGRKRTIISGDVETAGAVR